MPSHLCSGSNAEGVQLPAHHLGHHLTAQAGQEARFHDSFAAVRLALPALAFLIGSPRHHLVVRRNCHRVLQVQHKSEG